MATQTPSSWRWRRKWWGWSKHTPVLASLCGTDPFRRMNLFLPQVEAAGFAGIQNFPTVGLIDGVFRQNLEETGISYALEVEDDPPRALTRYADGALLL